MGGEWPCLVSASPLKRSSHPTMEGMIQQRKTGIKRWISHDLQGDMFTGACSQVQEFFRSMKSIPCPSKPSIEGQSVSAVLQSHLVHAPVAVSSS